MDEDLKRLQIPFSFSLPAVVQILFMLERLSRKISIILVSLNLIPFLGKKIFPLCFAVFLTKRKILKPCIYSNSSQNYWNCPHNLFNSEIHPSTKNANKKLKEVALMFRQVCAYRWQRSQQSLRQKLCFLLCKRRLPCLLSSQTSDTEIKHSHISPWQETFPKHGTEKLSLTRL